MAKTPSPGSRQPAAALLPPGSGTVAAKERAFVDAFSGPAAGNGTKAAITAGYARKSAAVTASRLLRKAKVRAALMARIQRQEERNVGNADERDSILSAIARGSNLMATVGDRIRAICELNKCAGRHSVSVNVKSRLTLEQALSQSREGED